MYVDRLCDARAVHGGSALLNRGNSGMGVHMGCRPSAPGFFARIRAHWGQGGQPAP